MLLKYFVLFFLIFCGCIHQNTHARPAYQFSVKAMPNPESSSEHGFRPPSRSPLPESADTATSLDISTRMDATTILDTDSETRAEIPAAAAAGGEVAGAVSGEEAESAAAEAMGADTHGIERMKKEKGWSKRK